MNIPEDQLNFPPVPQHLIDRLGQQCPSHPKARVVETHTLMYIPGSLTYPQMKEWIIKRLECEVVENAVELDGAIRNMGATSGEWSLITSSIDSRTLNKTPSGIREIASRDDYQTASLVSVFVARLGFAAAAQYSDPECIKDLNRYVITSDVYYRALRRPTVFPSATLGPNPSVGPQLVALNISHCVKPIPVNRIKTILDGIFVTENSPDCGSMLMWT
ncbi:MAG: hypothetical protein WCF19_06210 [Chlamydiales bacterium]